MTCPWTNARNVSHILHLFLMILPRCSKNRTSQGGLVICCSSFPQLFPECPVVTVTLTSIDRLVGSPPTPGVSIARGASQLTITEWRLCAGSCPLLASQTGPCLRATIPWSLQADTTEQSTSLFHSLIKPKALMIKSGFFRPSAVEFIFPYSLSGLHLPVTFICIWYFHLSVKKLLQGELSQTEEKEHESFRVIIVEVDSHFPREGAGFAPKTMENSI